MESQIGSQPQTIENLLKSQDRANLFDKKCEVCGRLFSGQGEGGKFPVCSRRCKEVKWRFFNYRDNPLLAERIILKLAGEKYARAKLEDMYDLPFARKLWQCFSYQDLFLYGSIGSGKTFAMAALLRRLVYLGFECKRINYDRFIIDYCALPFAEKTCFLDKHILVDKLFIDDLCLSRDQQSQFKYEIFYQLLNSRQEKELSTYITTNHSLEEIGGIFDARIKSRLEQAFIYKLTGPDRRSRFPDTRSSAIHVADTNTNNAGDVNLGSGFGNVKDGRS
jgi:hypothetical protein